MFTIKTKSCRPLCAPKLIKAAQELVQLYYSKVKEWSMKCALLLWIQFWFIVRTFFCIFSGIRQTGVRTNFPCICFGLFNIWFYSIAIHKCWLFSKLSRLLNKKIRYTHLSTIQMNFSFNFSMATQFLTKHTGKNDVYKIFNQSIDRTVQLQQVKLFCTRAAPLHHLNIQL